MEYYQATQNRIAETVAVINRNLPGLSVGGQTAAALSSTSSVLDTMAQTRDDALAAFDEANNSENLGFLTLQSLTLALPQAAAVSEKTNPPRHGQTHPSGKQATSGKWKESVSVHWLASDHSP